MRIWVHIAAAVLSAAIFIGLFTERPVSEAEIKSNNREICSFRGSENPDPQRLASQRGIPGEEQLYVMILDSSFSAEAYHCVAYEQWCRPLLEYERIDGIEFYSGNGWTNDICDISAVTVPIETSRSNNPTSELLYNSLKLFLKRSDSEWLFIIGDAAHIHVEKFISLIEKIVIPGSIDTVYSRGSCVERRPNFHMFTTGSGVVLSRSTVLALLSENEIWSVGIEVGLPSDETLSHALAKIGVDHKSETLPELLGASFHDPEHYKRLHDKDFTGLEACGATNTAKGCMKTPQRMSDIVVWSGAGAHTPKAKRKFLVRAPEMLSDLPENIRFYWNGSVPVLCK